MTKIYDLIIIGAGPAGITAAVYAARKRMDFCVISKDIGGQAAWSGDVENYTGYQFVTGPELAAKFEEHLRQYRIDLKESEEIVALKRGAGSGQRVITDKAEYEARAVIIASGKRSRELGVPGENEFKNKGVTYCATCDGPLFGGKDVAIVGGGNSALDAALQMTRIAQHTYVINSAPQTTGDKVMAEKAASSSGVTIMNNAQVTAITGDRFVSGIAISHEGTEKRLAVQGIFIEIGLVPNSGFAQEVATNDLGEIKIDCRNRTDIPGVFAAGDVTDVPEKQIIIAAGEGAKACLSAFRYLAEKK
ncbi:MAG TPA: FAD-dependent oxidoreductase [Candidatus Omnitrophota bacterium]|nr:FAD-dependent oxidoreductase [Candidatus Omnitrophota bacterium]HNQ50458.1 FAD-dependent oxidoreductase [Candidatus Omnitrophota bacterium]HQO38652.1 FAD-dependent oxidoreductase [Candidatus Omnitrophota bacterium]HQQ05725.1 FAD-dependent oxidoreductase [Candidatus Omnitrophota bacterium]